MPFFIKLPKELRYLCFDFLLGIENANTFVAMSLTSKAHRDMVEAYFNKQWVFLKKRMADEPFPAVPMTTQLPQDWMKAYFSTLYTTYQKGKLLDTVCLHLNLFMSLLGRVNSNPQSAEICKLFHYFYEKELAWESGDKLKSKGVLELGVSFQTYSKMLDVLLSEKIPLNLHLSKYFVSLIALSTNKAMCEIFLMLRTRDLLFRAEITRKSDNFIGLFSEYVDEVPETFRNKPLEAELRGCLQWLPGGEIA